MKVGTIFEHPTKDGGVVRLKAVSEKRLCDGCIFGKAEKGCKNDIIERDERITGSCSPIGREWIIFVEKDYPTDKLTRIMDLISKNTIIIGDKRLFLELEIKKILEE